MDMHLIPNDRVVAFWDGVCPSSLPYFIVPWPITPALQPVAHHAGWTRFSSTFVPCINMWSYGLSPTWFENWVKNRLWPQSHPRRGYWEAAETSALLTLLTCQQEQQHPSLSQGWNHWTCVHNVLLASLHSMQWLRMNVRANTYNWHEPVCLWASN